MTHRSSTLRPAVVAFTLLAGLSLSACNTIRGAGQDLEEGGEAISNTAQDVQDDLTDSNPNTP